MEKDKENNIRENKNNIVNYLDIPDIWDITISSKVNFHKELSNLKELNICVNQIVSLYDFLGEDINDEYFEDVKKELKKEEEIKIIEQKQIPNREEEINEANDNDDEDNSDDYSNKSDDEDDNGDKDYI